MVLEATCQVIILRPYFRNVGKRLVKAPKVYFADVGTLCYLGDSRSLDGRNIESFTHPEGLLSR
jgi:hypothetical protein